jgi:hypothetical protein
MSGDQRIEKYLSEAQPHSQGAFTWDALRMAQLFSLYAELDPHNYVLHCLAVAVLGGASFFELRARGTSTTLRWDGKPILASDLEQLGPQGNDRQAALGLALSAAARLGRVSLSVQGGCLEFDPRAGWRNRPAQGEWNGLKVTLSQWWLAFAPSPALARLRSSGRYAPLSLNVRLPGPRLCKWAVCWGEPPRSPCQPDEWVRLPVSEWGSGCVFPGEGRWTMVVDGIGYAVPGTWPELDLVWWGSFPLDLERADLVQGEQLQSWKIWLALQLCPITGERRWAGVPLDLLLEHGGEEVWSAAWYQRADGRAASLHDLQAHYDRWGFLPIVGIPGPVEAFVFAEGFPRELQELYPNWSYVPEPTSRLPEDENYLVRVPLDSGGEVGMRAHAGFGQRVWTEKGWRALDRKPHGLDFSVENPRDYSLVLALIYSCLLEMECPRPSAGTFHTLAYIDYLIFTRQMRVPSDPIVQPHPNGVYGHLTLQELVAAYPVQLLSGEAASVLTVADSWLGYVDLNSPRGFVCDYLALELLRTLKPLEAPYQLRSRPCHRLIEEGQGPLLQRLRSDPDCAAARVLRLLPDLQPAEDVELSEARKELGQGSVFLSTFHLLLALTRGPERIQLLKILPEWLEVEHQEDLAEMESLCSGELRLVWLRGKIESLLRVQCWSQAEHYVHEANQKFAGHWLAAYLSALVTGFRGDYDGAYRSLERAQERGGPPSLLQPYLWSAARLTKGPLAKVLFLERPLAPSSQVLAIAQISEVSKRVEQCVQLLQLAHCPSSIHEVLGDALAEAGELEAARQSWRLFLAARHDQLMEFDLPARQKRIARKLQPSAT